MLHISAPVSAGRAIIGAAKWLMWANPVAGTVVLVVGGSLIVYGAARAGKDIIDRVK